MDNIGDIRLVKKAKKGDKDALITLIMNRKDEYYKLAYSYMGNQEDALDVMQDTIVLVYENILTLKKDSSFITWSKSILVNCCKQALRKRNKISLLNGEEQTNEKEERMRNNSEEYLTTEKRIDINVAIEKLNYKQQEAIKLRYFMDMDYESIAKITNTPIGTIKSRISTGIKKLKEVMGGMY